MKIQTAIIIMPAIVIIIFGLIAVVSFNLNYQNTYAIKQGNCNSNTLNFLWEHTYGAGRSHWSFTQSHSRLKELSPACVVFEGNVTGTPSDPEHDGDFHIDVKPAGTKPNDNWDLLNVNNTKGLVAEVICWNTPDYHKYSNFQGHFCDGVDARAHIPILKQGDHVRITGKWVKDIGYPAPDHPEWNEIHPVESIEKLP